MNPCPAGRTDNLPHWCSPLSCIQSSRKKKGTSDMPITTGNIRMITACQRSSVPPVCRVSETRREAGFVFKVWWSPGMISVVYIRTETCSLGEIKPRKRLIIMYIIKWDSWSGYADTSSRHHSVVSMHVCCSFTRQCQRFDKCRTSC